jgi:hypothetical protein
MLKSGWLAEQQQMALVFRGQMKEGLIGSKGA